MLPQRSASAFARKHGPQVRGFRGVAAPWPTRGDRRVENQTSNFQNGHQFRETHGEILDGAVLELVTASSGDKLDLVYWDGQNYEIGPQFQYGSVVYHVPYLHSSLFQGATRFPCGLAEYGAREELAWKIVALFRRYMGFSQSTGRVRDTRCF